MIRIVYGKAKSGKTSHVYDEILERYKSGDTSIFLIVPEQYTLEAEKQLIDFGALEGLIGIDVLSFKRLAFRIFSEVGSPTGVQISEVGQLMLLRKLFSENSSDLSVYQSAYNKMGFLSKMRDLIKELKQTMIQPNDLDRYIDALSDQTLLKNKLSDVRAIYRAYEAEKEKVYFDDEDTYDHLLAALCNSKKMKSAFIWIDGFDSYTKQELAIIEGLMINSKETTITLCSDGQLTPGIFDHTNTFFNKFMDIAKKNDIPVKTIACKSNYLNDDIKHIAENIGAYPYIRQERTTADIRIFAADNRMNEIEYCAAQMLDFVVSGDYKWQDFAVVTNDLDAYEMAVKVVFDEMNIPHFIDKKVSALHNPLVRLILAYLKMVRSGFECDSVMHFLKSGFFSFDAESLHGFENYIKHFGISEKKLNVPFEEVTSNGSNLEQINAVRERLLNFVKASDIKKGPFKYAALHIIEMLNDVDAHEIMKRRVDRFIESSEFDQAQYNTQIWNLTMDLLDQAVALMGEDVFELDEVIHILEAGFEAIEVGLLPLLENQVLIGSVDRSRAHPIKVLFFLGFNDGIIPELGQDKQLILDSEKAVFKERGFDFISDQTIFMSKEQFNIYFALTRPSEKLFFSYARSDAEGGALRPSYFISKLKKICPNITMVDERVCDSTNLYRVSNARGTIKHLAEEMRRGVDGYPISDLWYNLFGWYVINRPKTAHMLLRGLMHSNVVDRLEHSSVLDAYQMPIRTNVSELEQFVLCPFKYFVDAGLKPIPQKKYELAAPDIGTLFHKALELYGKTVYDTGLVWADITREESSTMIEKIVDEMTKHDIFESKHQYRYLANRLKRVSKKAAWMLTKHLKEGTFEPAAFEVAFGRTSDSAPPIHIKLSSGESMLIRGVIDRVDLAEIDGQTYVKIIDYKSGRKSLTMSDIYNGLQMQLMVYLSACLTSPELLKVDRLLPAGAFYFRIDDPIIESTTELADIIESQIAAELKLDGFALEASNVLKHLDHLIFDNGTSEIIDVKIKKDGMFSKDSKVMSLEAFEGLTQHVREKIKAIGESLEVGNVEIAPCKSGAFTSCQYCDYKSICQFDPHFEGNRYRQIKAYSNEEVLKKIGVIPDGEMDI